MKIIVALLNSNYNGKLHFLLQLLIFFVQLHLFSFKHYYCITFVCITQSSLLFIYSSNPNNKVKHLLKFSLMKGVPSLSVPQTWVISRYQEITRYTSMTKSAISDYHSWDQTCRWRLPQHNPCQMQDATLYLPTQCAYYVQCQRDMGEAGTNYCGPAGPLIRCIKFCLSP